MTIKFLLTFPQQRPSLDVNFEKLSNIIEYITQSHIQICIQTEPKNTDEDNPNSGFLNDYLKQELLFNLINWKQRKF